MDLQASREYIHTFWLCSTPRWSTSLIYAFLPNILPCLAYPETPLRSIWLAYLSSVYLFLYHLSVYLSVSFPLRPHPLLDKVAWLWPLKTGPWPHQTSRSHCSSQGDLSRQFPQKWVSALRGIFTSDAKNMQYSEPHAKLCQVFHLQEECADSSVLGKCSPSYSNSLSHASLLCPSRDVYFSGSLHSRSFISSLSGCPSSGK